MRFRTLARFYFQRILPRTRAHVATMLSGAANLLDMGIQGSGFFVLSDNGSLSYTRAGTFSTKKPKLKSGAAGT